MPITIKGVRITSITVSRDESGAEKVQSSYQLISSTDKVLATETLSSKSEYGSQPTFVPPNATMKALQAAVDQYKKDVEEHLGMTE